MRNFNALIIASAVVALAAPALRSAAPAGPGIYRPRRRRELSRRLQRAVADFHKDGTIDVIANSLQAQELAWYENPGWEKRVITTQVQQVVKQAMDDIDGDGTGGRVPERLRDAAGEQPRPQMDREERRQPAPAVEDREDRRVSDRRITSSGPIRRRRQEELLNAPLLGRRAPRRLRPGQGPGVLVRTKDWKRHVVAADIPGNHPSGSPGRVGQRQARAVLVASFEGIALYRATGSGEAMKFEKTLLSPATSRRRRGSARAKSASAGRTASASLRGRAVAHGNEVVVIRRRAANGRAASLRQGDSGQ